MVTQPFEAASASSAAARLRLPAARGSRQPTACDRGGSQIPSSIGNGSSRRCTSRETDRRTVQLISIRTCDGTVLGMGAYANAANRNGASAAQGLGGTSVRRNSMVQADFAATRVPRRTRRQAVCMHEFTMHDRRDPRRRRQTLTSVVWWLRAGAAAEDLPLHPFVPPAAAERILRALLIRGLVRRTPSGWIPSRPLLNPAPLVILSPPQPHAYTPRRGDGTDQVTLHWAWRHPSWIIGGLAALSGMWYAMSVWNE